MRLHELDRDKHYRVTGWRGIAFYFVGPETRPDEDTEWTGVEELTGMALMVMVGDDYEHVVDPVDVIPIDEDSFCRDCGQVGCGWNVANDTPACDEQLFEEV